MAKDKVNVEGGGGCGGRVLLVSFVGRLSYKLDCEMKLEAK
jgi:hypothetical protein